LRAFARSAKLDALVAKAGQESRDRRRRNRKQPARLGNDREALIEELRAERQAHAKAASQAAQEAEAAAWLEARRAEGLSDS